jgi:hypothetical protein
MIISFLMSSASSSDIVKDRSPSWLRHCDGLRLLSFVFDFLRTFWRRSGLLLSRRFLSQPFIFSLQPFEFRLILIDLTLLILLSLTLSYELINRSMRRRSNRPTTDQRACLLIKRAHNSGNADFSNLNGAQSLNQSASPLKLCVAIRGYRKAYASSLR